MIDPSQFKNHVFGHIWFFRPKLKLYFLQSFFQSNFCRHFKRFTKFLARKMRAERIFIFLAQKRKFLPFWNFYRPKSKINFPKLARNFITVILCLLRGWRLRRYASVNFLYKSSNFEYCLDLKIMFLAIFEFF